MVYRLVELLCAGVSWNAAGHEREVQHRVDFVEGEPVFHASRETFKQDAGVAFVESNECAVGPATVFPGQVEWGFVVAYRHQRFDAVFFQFVEDAFVEA